MSLLGIVAKKYCEIMCPIATWWSNNIYIDLSMLKIKKNGQYIKI